MAETLLRERMSMPLHGKAMIDPDGVGVIGNPACGDLLSLFVRMKGDVISDASFTSMGSPFQLATADVLCDCIIGEHAKDALNRGPACVLVKLPDLPQNKKYLAQLAIDALHRALAQKGAVPARPNKVRAVLENEAAAEYIEALLADGRRWSTVEIDANMRADGLGISPALARVLLDLRRNERISGELISESGAWRWWLEESPRRKSKK